MEKNMKSPDQLRKTILSNRTKQSETEIEEKSSKIEKRLLQMKEISDADNIFIYVNFRSEVQTIPIIRQLIASGKQVSVPLTMIKERRLKIITITDPDNELVAGYCNIPEPREELVATQEISPELLDVIILPGSVFDNRCGRFGYGGGYYDRLLSSIPRAARIALAFELQLVEQLPLQDHDEILDCILTEKQTIRCSGR